MNVEKYFLCERFVKCEGYCTWQGKGEDCTNDICQKKCNKIVPRFAVFDAGISVHPKFPFLGATPDGKVFDPSSNSKYGLLEVKCPFSKRGDQAAEDPAFYIEKIGANFYLKKSHSYFAQVHGLPWCDFCVYLSDSNEMCVDRIHFDPDYWENKLLPKLCSIRTYCRPTYCIT